MNISGDEGEVMVTAYPDGHYVETDIQADGVMNFLHEDEHGYLVNRLSTSSFEVIEAAIRKAL